ncbi:NAD(P)/FAD-dependent oxidoreductase [Streptomyces tendae]|uniref:NAD(P)/FAD-dependent oxidoreductase n=1 Tax=Streptomyces tendae TaxID=1932 RepID=UPI0033D9DBE8
MSAPGSVLVVGASAAGLATAEALRRKGFHGSLTLLDADAHPPYDRPPLSKQYLAGTWDTERLRLRGDEQLASLDAAFVREEPAVALDTGERRVRTASGRTYGADAVVIATGLVPRALPGAAGLAGVHRLRGLDDAAALRSALAADGPLVVVGDGVLGAEIAATARGAGCDVTLVGRGPAPLHGRFGPVVAGLLARLHEERGVRLRFGAGADLLLGDRGAVSAVALADGRVLPATRVVAAIGSMPATDWLTGSGLSLADGVVCDSRCRAAEGIWAVGDVARFHHGGTGLPTRLENRTNATEQAQCVAADILGDGRPYTPVPYMWTDQYEAKIQVHGLPSAHDDVDVVEGAVDERRFVARYRRHGRVTAILGWNMPKQSRLHRAAHTDDLAGTPATVS